MSSINALLFLFIFLRTPGQNAAEHRADQAEHQAKMNIIVEHLGADDNSYVDQEKIGDGVTENPVDVFHGGSPSCLFRFFFTVTG